MSEQTCVVPTSDEDWHRLIDEDDPNRPLRAGADAWLVFEAFVSMESAKAAHDAIRQADAVTVRQALLAAVVSRRATPNDARGARGLAQA